LGYAYGATLQHPIVQLLHDVSADPQLQVLRPNNPRRIDSDPPPEPMAEDIFPQNCVDCDARFLAENVHIREIKADIAIVKDAQRTVGKDNFFEWNAPLAEDTVWWAADDVSAQIRDCCAGDERPQEWTC